MNMKNLEKTASSILQAPLQLVSARESLPAHKLNRDASRQLHSFTTERRRQQWLRGRQALTLLGDRLGEGDIDLATNPPRAGVSLTHNAELSIAAGLLDSAGIGIDLESWQRVRDSMLYWFLTTAEQQQLRVTSNFTRVRLWTIKEALFKASPDNQGLHLTDFELDDVAAVSGDARCLADDGRHFRYTSLILRRGVFSIAIQN